MACGLAIGVRCVRDHRRIRGQVFVQLVQGVDIPEIAKRSFLAPTTVQWHLANVYEKIGANGRSGLIARFFKDVVYAGIAPETPAGDALTQP